MGKKSNKQLKERRRVQLEEQRAQNKKQSIRILLSTLCIILCATLLISGGVFGGMAIYNAYLDSGKPYRNIVSYKTEHYQINNAMLSFYFYDYLYNGLLEKMGLEHPSELKGKYFTFTDQETGKEESVSYFNYYNELAAYDFQSDLLCAEAAADFGVSLDERDRSFIANRLKSIENSASTLGMKTSEYISATYGRGVKLSDIEKALEITTLAEKQYAVCYAGQTVTDAEIKSYLAEHELNYTKVDYYLHILTVTDESKREEVKALADKLMDCKTDEEFLTELKEQLTDTYGDDKDFDVEKEVESTVMSEYVQPISESSTELDRFLYNPDAKQGDSFLSVGQKSYGVVRILKEQYSTDTPQDTLRIIRLDYNNFASKADALSAASALKKQLNGKSEEDFAKAARAESHDRVTALLDGLYVLTDNTATVEQLSGAKLTDKKVGELIEFSNDNSIWIAYYCGKGITASEAYAENTLRSKKFTSMVDDLADKYPMTYDTSKISRIAPLSSAD